MGISMGHLLVVLLIVLLLFGTKRLRAIGGDLGSAIKGFRSSVRDEEAEATPTATTTATKLDHTEAERVINGEVAAREKNKV